MSESPPRRFKENWEHRSFGDVVTLHEWVSETRTWIVHRTDGSTDVIADDDLERDYVRLGDDDDDDMRLHGDSVSPTATTHADNLL